MQFTNGTTVNFRDQLIAASLKRNAARSVARSAAHFRDQLIAASLKRLSDFPHPVPQRFISAIN